MEKADIADGGNAKNASRPLRDAFLSGGRPAPLVSPSNRFSALPDKDQKRRDARRDSTKERFLPRKQATGSDGRSKERSGVARSGRGTRQRSPPNGLRRVGLEPPGLERKGRQAPNPGAVPPTVAPSVRAIPDRLRKQVREIVRDAGPDGIVLSALQDRLKLDYTAFGFTRLAQMVEAMGVCSISKSSGKVSQPILYIKGLDKGGIMRKSQPKPAGPNGQAENADFSVSYDLAVERFLARVQTAKQSGNAKDEEEVEGEEPVTATEQEGEIQNPDFFSGEYIATCHWQQEIPECTTLPVYPGLRLVVSWMDDKGHWAYARINAAEAACGYVPQSAIVPASRPVLTRAPDERVRLSLNWSPTNWDESTHPSEGLLDSLGNDDGDGLHREDDGGLSGDGYNAADSEASAWLPGTCAMTELVVVETSPCGQLVYCQTPDFGTRGWIPESILE
eukprot:GEMP01022526.1.p1 GENE.GEMP01022526.1~~GEMP01022526.1.p1  ORF type:complete len:449 (+),score=107.26 GEMP01022526.1:94-1440(+)